MIPVNLSPDNNIILMSKPDTPIQAEQDLGPVSIPESRVSGGIEKEPKHKNVWNVAIGAIGTIVAYTLGPLIGDLIKATPGYQSVHAWFSEIELSPLFDFLQTIWRIVEQLAI